MPIFMILETQDDRNMSKNERLWNIKLAVVNLLFAQSEKADFRDVLETAGQVGVGAPQ